MYCTGYIEFGEDVTGKDQSTKLLLSSQDEVSDVFNLRTSTDLGIVFSQDCTYVTNIFHVRFMHFTSHDSFWYHITKNVAS